MRNELGHARLEDHSTHASARRNRDLFDHLYRRYLNDIRALCHRMIGNRSRAEELAQETFVRVLANIDSVDESRVAWPWLSTIAHRLCIDELRHQGVQASVSPGEIVSAISERTALVELGDPTAGEVIRRTEREAARTAMNQALSKLSPRNRRILMLRDVERWNYEDIAGATGTTVHSVRNLAWRARNQVRAFLVDLKWGVPALTPLATSLDPGRGLLARGASWLRRLRQGIERNPMFHAAARPGVSEGITAMILPVLGAAIIASALPSPSSTSSEAKAFFRASAVVTDAARHVGSMPDNRDRASLSRAVVPPDPPMDEPYRDRFDEMNRRLVDPTGDATPENTGFLSLVAAPGYGRSNSIMLGLADCARARVDCRVLFSTVDGGASWVKLPSDGLMGDSLFLPPDYPRDPRIFVMGATGLQASADGGRTFDTVSPFTGSVSISPSFDAGDPRIFIGGAHIYEYRADTGLTRLFQAVPEDSWSYRSLTSQSRRVILSPRFAEDHLYFYTAGTRDLSFSSSHLHRCVGADCTLSLREVREIAISSTFSTDRGVFVQAGGFLYRSDDAGETFAAVHDYSWSRRKEEGPTPLVSGSTMGRWENGLYSVGRVDDDDASLKVLRSLDGGRTWAPLPSEPLYYYALGAEWVMTTPTGRIFALGRRGIACSSDQGKTWRLRCEPE